MSRRRRAGAHLRRHYVEIPVWTPEVRISVGRLQLILDPTYWRRGRFAFPPDWRKLPPVQGVVAPIVRTWSLGPVHLNVFRWDPHGT